MRFLAALLLAFTLTMPALAQQQQEAVPVIDKHLSDPVLEARARALETELRCPVCQSQSIADSNAPIAADLRNLVRDHIQAGETDQQIKDFVVARYGSFVLMNPPVQGDTLALWFGPAILILIGGGIIGAIVMRSRNRLASEPVVDGSEPNT